MDTPQAAAFIVIGAVVVLFMLGSVGLSESFGVRVGS